MQLIKSFNHLYLIQVLLRLQKNFGEIYAQLKHKITLLIRARLIRMKIVAKTSNPMIHSGNKNIQDYYVTGRRYSKPESRHDMFEQNNIDQNNLNNNNYNFISDLNELIMSQVSGGGCVRRSATNGLASGSNTGNSISIPMQLLFLPLVVPTAVNQLSMNDPKVQNQAVNQQTNDGNGQRTCNPRAPIHNIDTLNKQDWFVEPSRSLTMRNPFNDFSHKNNNNHHHLYSYGKNCTSY